MESFDFSNLARGNTIIIAGKRGTGKTTLALRIAQHFQNTKPDTEVVLCSGIKDDQEAFQGVATRVVRPDLMQSQTWSACQGVVVFSDLYPAERRYPETGSVAVRVIVVQTVRDVRAWAGADFIFVTGPDDVLNSTCDACARMLARWQMLVVARGCSRPLLYSTTASAAVAAACITEAEADAEDGGFIRSAFAALCKSACFKWF
jgi:RecA/RadA recombinase